MLRLRASQIRIHSVEVEVELCRRSRRAEHRHSTLKSHSHLHGLYAPRPRVCDRPRRDTRDELHSSSSEASSSVSSPGLQFPLCTPGNIVPGHDEQPDEDFQVHQLTLKSPAASEASICSTVTLPTAEGAKRADRGLVQSCSDYPEDEVGGTASGAAEESSDMTLIINNIPFLLQDDDAGHDNRATDFCSRLAAMSQFGQCTLAVDTCSDGRQSRLRERDAGLSTDFESNDGKDGIDDQTGRPARNRACQHSSGDTSDGTIHHPLHTARLRPSSASDGSSCSAIFGNLDNLHGPVDAFHDDEGNDDGLPTVAEDEPDDYSLERTIDGHDDSGHDEHAVIEAEALLGPVGTTSAIAALDSRIAARAGAAGAAEAAGARINASRRRRQHARTDYTERHLQPNYAALRAGRPSSEGTPAYSAERRLPAVNQENLTVDEQLVEARRMWLERGQTAGVFQHTPPREGRFERYL